jgi:hypothetical protein
MAVNLGQVSWWFDLYVGHKPGKGCLADSRIPATMGAVKNHGQSKSRALACEPDVSLEKGLDRLKVQGCFSPQRREPRRDAVFTFINGF